MKKPNADTRKFYKVIDRVSRLAGEFDATDLSAARRQHLKTFQAIETKLGTIKERKLSPELRSAKPHVQAALTSFIYFIEYEDAESGERAIEHLDEAMGALGIVDGEGDVNGH
ncbi:hypothetical protein [Halobacillus naozhouensis]|uniref:Uncharacterized protein n=1 Tax=Halobacillus naozhouensis TaxID=554880 RepID=A0ABY8IXD8_9BACI|nr:hypothetical protein [Halobacillus naozhouensis]WFT74894.1 hypothetical protein P9989_00190 [Halobacillus naozhouensis]